MTEEKRGLIPHFWTNEPGQLLKHHSTGLRFVCTQQRPGPANSENWDVLVLYDGADLGLVDAEAEIAGMRPDDYANYLAETSIELAAKAEKKHPRKRLKF